MSIHDNYITIAIDGYSSCGKSTLAKEIAKYYKYLYIDSGAMYRSVTFYCIENDLFVNNTILTDKLEKQISNLVISFEYNSENNINTTFLNGINVENKIRGFEVSNWVSPVSELDFVRKEMVKLQRKMAKNNNIVMDGRDIGTVVFPEADIKIFMTASEEIRAKRRYQELKGRTNAPSIEDVKENIRKRDYIDSHRKISPLKKAADAFIIDNSNLTREEQFNRAIELINKKPGIC